MTGTSRLSLPAARALTALPLVAVLSACAAAVAARPASPAAATEAEVERGPRVRIWTTDDFGSLSRVRPAFRLEDDAYVIVVNVGLDGYVNVLFPESPEDDGFMRGGRTYRLPSFFPGFVNYFRASRYGRLYNATRAYDDIYDRYAGYVFIIASWRPMHFELAEDLGLWDGYRLAASEEQLEPYAMMHRYAERLVGRRARDYTARFARYAAFGGGFARGGSFASCALYGSGFGSFPWWAFHTGGSWWIPIHGFGSYGLGSRCGYGFGVAITTGRPRGGSIVAPPVTPPTTTPRDTVGRGRRLRDRPPPVGDSATGPEGRARPGRREAEEETVVDVTPETRAAARRREREAARGEYWSRAERGRRAPADWDRDERGTPSERASGRWDADRRAGRARPAADHDTPARAESSRREPRASEPRREAPPRTEPRSEPRQDVRPQPVPRSAPAPRPEPRAERPAARPADPQ